MDNFDFTGPTSATGLETKMTQVFDFEPREFAESYAEKGYVHIAHGVCPEFLRQTQQLVNDLLADPNQTALHEFEIKGKKRQFLFDFPPGSLEGVFDAVAEVAGLDRRSITICERHIKVYDDAANKNPPPHKDRVASQVTVGLPLEVGPDSYLELYPQDLLTVNPYNTTALWRSSLDANELPEVALQNATRVKLKVKPGDTVMFRGASIYHERINAAGTRVLYLKFNDMRLDPSGEDPSTNLQIDRTLRALEGMSDEQLLDSVVEVCPKLVQVSRHYTRLNWQEALQCYVTGQPGFNLSSVEFDILKQANSHRTVRSVLESIGIPRQAQANHVPGVRRLLQRTALVFIRDQGLGV